MKASCREVRTSADGVSGMGGSLEKEECRLLSAPKSFETGSKKLGLSIS
jgi:hypothetical protein